MVRTFKTLAFFSSFVACAGLASAASPPAATRAVAPADVSIGDIVAVTIYLPMRGRPIAEAQARAVQTAYGPQYHGFLGESEFVARYGPTDKTISQVERALAKLGFRVNYVYPNHLALEAVTTAGNAHDVLGVTLKHFVVDGRSGIASTTPARVPAALAGEIRGFAGFDTVAHAHPNYMRAAVGARAPFAAPKTLVGGTPGNYLPADFENFYAVFQGDIAGTIGIVTLNNFRESDAYAFWKAIGLNVSQRRITKVDVDGGETAPTNNPGGEGETDLDVEQSGAIAPGADIRVYIAPNITNSNFVNAFEAAASEDLADTISTSWGQPELDFFYNVATKTSGETFLLEAFHDVFLEMALQGQTVFAASGDSGSFDTVRGCPTFGRPSPTTPVCNAPYSVDHPASDPLVTAAGGTTLPFSFTLQDGTKLSVPKERAWSWRYIANQIPGISNLVFAVGGGGGVSSYWPKPWYEFATPGVTLTKPGQALVQNTGSGDKVQYVLPAQFDGRNMPDISTNADPESGYQVLQDGQVFTFGGGTSFVAPQLNGTVAGIVGQLGYRVGQLNPLFYSGGTLPDLAYGDNWGYRSIAGYDNASGNGILSGANLYSTLQNLGYGYYVHRGGKPRN